MFRAANSTGALPLLEERLSWLPVNQAGQAVAEIVLSTAQSGTKSAVYHVLNPHNGTWDDVLAGLKEGGLTFEAVERREWLDRLAKSDPDVTANPSYKLLVSLVLLMCG